MKKILGAMIVFIILITFIGCSIFNKNEQVIMQDPSVKTSQKTADLLKVFEESLPHAEIVAKIMADLDDDKEDDLVIIFIDNVDPLKITKSNLCVVTNYGINAIDLSGSTLNFQFAYGLDSLKILQNPTKVSVMLEEVATNKIFDFQVAMTLDKIEKITSFKIDSIELPNK